jgi:hypothetical protein
VTLPAAGENKAVTRILVGMADAYSGLDAASLTVTADCEIDGAAAGTNLADRFKSLGDGRWELTLQRPLAALPKATLTVSVKDRQGNENRIVRSFSVR